MTIILLCFYLYKLWVNVSTALVLIQTVMLHVSILYTDHHQALYTDRTSQV